MSRHIGQRVPALDGVRGYPALAKAAMHLSVSFGLLAYSPLETQESWSSSFFRVT